jgi:glycosyltransferase involved in cell wall biosynthesis
LFPKTITDVTVISIVIPAHNESSVIRRTLQAMTCGSQSNELDIIVICNGCTDDTAQIARSVDPSIRVIETPQGNKTNALNLGDQLATAFPRIYSDADVVIALDTIRALESRLEKGDVLAVAPRPSFDFTGCSLAVRAFYDIKLLLPSQNEGIGGSGVYALSKIGRNRFGQFPNVAADDGYVRIQFRPDERETLAHVSSTVFPPRRLNALIAVRTRVSFGNLQLARLFPELFKNRGNSNYVKLIKLIRIPYLWPKLLIYIYVNIVARRKARELFRSNTFVWHKDTTSRPGHGTVT